MSDAREELDRIIREKGMDYAAISRLIGRNAAYIQQFVKRGTPRKLDEEDRRVIATYLGVDEALLGGPASTTPMPQSFARTRALAPMIVVPRLDVGASAGPGALADQDALSGAIGFDPHWLRALGANPNRLSMIRVQGESMLPTLSDGDEILVDQSDAADRIRDGIYVLRVDDTLIVKRLAMNPATRGFQIRSDNPDFPGWSDCAPDQVNIIGRVVWAGRKLR